MLLQLSCLAYNLLWAGPPLLTLRQVCKALKIRHFVKNKKGINKDEELNNTN